MDPNNFSLEKEALELCVQVKYNYEHTPTKVRNNFDSVQSTDVFKYPCVKSVEKFEIDSIGSVDSINVTIAVPPRAEGQQTDKPLPIIFYLHGGGFVIGSPITHDKIICELSNRTNSVVIAPDYSKSPEYKYPCALEECYSILLKCVSESKQRNWNSSNITLAGDSSGGNFAVVLSLLSKIRNGPKISKCLIYYPALDFSQDTISYQQFANGFVLNKDETKWYYDQYLNNENEKNEITVSPLRATIEQLKGFPSTCIISAEADILLTESESFTEKLLLANVPVTHVIFKSTIHGFAVTHYLDSTPTCRSAMDLSVAFINRPLKQ